MADARQQRQVVLACYLGWTLDAFDYFIMAFALDAVAAEFGASRTQTTWALFLTLAMRPLGAAIFGRIADRFGRRPTLMANVLIYSALECASGFAPTLTSFFVLRALYGVAMGGEWGVGAALTMESIPASWRGVVSGILQAGYPSGYLLATVVNQFAVTHVGWRGLFMLGALPALLVLFIRRNVPESETWARGQSAGPSATLRQALSGHLALIAYAIIMMAAFNVFSHGTQDLYKSFLSHDRRLGLPIVTGILVAMNIAAILGGISVAALSQRYGRRRAIVCAALISLPVVPLWALSTQPLLLGVGAFLMQLCVQGAWGVIPAHLNELSPPKARATFPGLTYQLGNLLAAVTAPLQSGLADRIFHHDLARPLALTVTAAACIIALIVGFGPRGEHAQMRLAELPSNH